MDNGSLGGNLVLRTQLGEHDYQKQVCGNSGFCPLYGSNTCPMNSNQNGSYYSCWGDKSGFEYDLMPKNSIGPSSPVDFLYDISRQGINHEYLKFSQWNAWIEKFQCDYRFGKVSDTNAQGILFPNVDNPWMFTEYVFQGLGENSSAKIKWDIPQEYIVQPPLYNPRTLELINYDKQLTSISDYNYKYFNHSSSSETSETSGSSETLKVRSFRKIQSWDALFLNKDKSTVYHKQRDEGVRLYHAKIPVQSIKWGEHGNVPPHTIDMTAPKKWFNPNESNLKYKVVYDAVIGTTLRAPDDAVGFVCWCLNSFDCYLTTFSEGNDSVGFQIVQKNVAIPYYKYSGVRIFSDYANLVNYRSSNHLILESPKYKKKMKIRPEDDEESQVWVGKKPTTTLMGIPGTQYLYHQGCIHCSADSSTVHCKYYQSLKNIDDKIKAQAKNNFLPRACCHGKNRNCRHMTLRESPPVIATFQSPVPQVQQITFNSSAVAFAFGAAMGLSAVGGVVGANVGMGFALGGATYVVGKFAEIYQSMTPREDAQITYVPRYVVEQSSQDVIKLNKQKYNQYGKDLQAIPGTGKFVIQQKSHYNNILRGDSILYNDINTLSFHRMFASVMHCATQKSCNSIIGPTSNSSGFAPGMRAGGDGYCNYYKKGCPYNGVSKRGNQFVEVMNRVYNQLSTMISMYVQATKLGAWNFKAGTIYPSTLGLYRRFKKGELQWLVFKDFAVLQVTDELAVIALKTLGGDFGHGASKKSDNQNFNLNLGGACIVRDDLTPIGYGLCAQMKTGYDAFKINDKNVKSYYCKQVYFWYCPLTNDGKTLKELGHIPAFDSSLEESRSVQHDGFDGNELTVTGTSDIVGSSSAEAPSGQPKNILPILRQTVDKNGYWFCKVQSHYFIPSKNCMMIDNEKKFIGGWHPEYKDYSKIGGEFLQDVTADWERQGQGMGDFVTGAGYKPIPMPTNKKGYWIDQSGEYIIDELNTGVGGNIASKSHRQNTNFDNTVCISFKKSNTEFDSETGEMKQPLVINGAVFSNDTTGIIETYRKQKQPKFKDQNGNEYYAPLIVNNIQMLPSNRKGIHCPNCDYYLSEKYLSIKECPWCFANMEQVTGIKKFFKLGAMGIVDVWDIPGSSFKMDAYFWRHQANATNLIRRQLHHKLGNITNGTQKADTNSPASEQTGGLPEGTGFFQKYDDKFGCMINYHMPENYFDNINKIDNEKQNFINPYHNSGVSDAGLKMLSLSQLISLRNKIQPIFAYTNNMDSSDYINKRASYNQRQIVDQPIIWHGRKAMVPTQVLAYTSDGVDSYQEYFSGDYVYGQTREFFPSGYTWWNMKGVIGGRKSLLQGGKYHMDAIPWQQKEDENGNVIHIMGKYGYMDGGSGGMFTIGQSTVSKCAISIHGLLPLNKEIVAAYLIAGASGIDPSRDPVGLTWTGGPPMYHHYHALKQQHKGDGTEAHFHGRAGHIPGCYYDENGDPHFSEFLMFVGQLFADIFGFNFNITPHPLNTPRFVDQSQHSLYGAFNNKQAEDAFIYYDDRFIDVMWNMSAIYDCAFYKNVGTPKKKINSLNQNDKEIYYGYDETSFANPYGFWVSQKYSMSDDKKKKMFQYLILNNDDDLVIKYPNSQVWKQVVKSQLDKEIQKHTSVIEFGASDGTEQNYVSTTFTEVDSSLYSDLIPKQSQGISGYFDMQWSNTKGYVYNTYNVQSNKKINWDAPVIFQDNAPTAQSSQKSTPSNSVQFGETQRVLNVTNVVKALYDDRIQRTFTCRAGTTLKDILHWEFYKPKGYVERKTDSSGKQTSTIKMDNDVKTQNNQEDFDNELGGYVLNDSFSYPKVDENLIIPEIDGQGNKYELAEKYAVLTIRFSQPFISIIKTGQQINSNYHIEVTDDDKQFGDYKRLKYSQYMVGNFGTLVQEIFGLIEISNSSDNQNNNGNKNKKRNDDIQIKCIDSFTFKVFSKKTIRIHNVPGNCYDLLGIQITDKSLILRPQQLTRILTDGKFDLSDFPQTSLVSTDRNMWKYKSFEDKPQDVIIDLARAPLCKQQRNWRNKQGSIDYSGCHCMDKSCLCNKIYTFDQYCVSKRMYSNKSDPQCPACGRDAQDAKRDDNGKVVWAKGAIQHKGDGIMTYFYDKMFSPSPFITYISFKLDNEKGNFNISVRSSLNDEWFTIAFGNEGIMTVYNGENSWLTNKKYEKDVDIDFPEGIIVGRFIKIEVGQKMQFQYKQLPIYYNKKNKNNWVYESYGFLGYFLRCYGDSDYNKLSSIDLYNSYAIIGNQDVNKIPTVDEFMSQINKVYSAFQSNSSSTTNNDSSSVEGYTGNYATKYGYAVKIASGSKQVMGQNNMYLLGLNRVFPQANQNHKTSLVPLTNKAAYLKFYIRKFVGGISGLAIYGTHYKTEQGEDVDNTDSGKKFLTMTGMPDEYKILIRQQQYQYELPFRPTQILSIMVGTDEFGGCPLIQADSFIQEKFESNDSSSSGMEFPNNLRWTTKQIEVNGQGILINKKYYIQKIIGGDYYYDIHRNKIHIPQVNQNGVKFVDFQKQLKNTAIYVGYMPTCIKIKYWKDNGKSITLPATADGHGPSYMVEKGAINTIITNNLPNNGTTGRILDPSGNETKNIKIPWQVYNNVPATLNVSQQSRSQTSQQIYTQFNAGQFRVNFSPSALNSSENRKSDESFVKLYGENCSNCFGVCETELTFTGAPNQILSGYITAAAPAQTERYIDAGNGIKYTYKQKTGGIKNGLIIARCQVTNTGAGRMTKTYNVPKLIIFAKDIDPFGNSENS